jgi:quercetin dioxygenase-like cupin family protein
MSKHEKSPNPININDVKKSEVFNGIFRSTLAYNEGAMLCCFTLEKGSKVPLHEHPNIQIGYVISGKLRFFNENSDFLSKEGDSYVFDENEKHGAEILEDSQLIEVFVPFRKEYID